ncbi:MAG: hypothetical protein ACKV2U_16925 [Bryobacteraceae bacterium]
MALGAQRGDVAGMLVRRGMILVAAGVGLGIVGSIALYAPNLPQNGYSSAPLAAQLPGARYGDFPLTP